MIINWFSPLPPARSGIASFTRFLLPYLQRRATVRLWTHQPVIETLSAEIVRYRPGRLTAQQEHMLETADQNIYNLGNNALHHADMLDLFLLYPGSAIIHDGNLRGLFRGYFHSRHSVPDLHKMVEHYSNGKSFSSHRRLQSRLADYLDREGSCHLETHIHRLAPKIWVHTSEAKRQFPKAKKLNLMYPVRSCPAPHSRGKGPIHVTLFGSLNAFRPIVPLLKILAAFPQKNSMVLHIVGHFLDDSIENSEAEIRKAVAKLKLIPSVSIHGFVSDERLEELLSMMDLAINLRTRSHGEASFSQLQIWSHGIPSVVSDIGWFKDLPDSIVTKVAPKDEKKVLHDIWRRAINGDPQLRLQGELGRQYLQTHHSPQAYADAILPAPSNLRRHQNAYNSTSSAWI